MLCQKNNFYKGFLIFNDDSLNLDFSLLEDFYALWLKFFLSEEKEFYKGDLTIPVGYFGLIKNNIITKHEDFYYFPNSILCPSKLRNMTDYMFTMLENFSNFLIKDQLSEHIQNSVSFFYLMRIIFYKNNNENKIKILNPSHVDKSYFTLLPRASYNGLQYKHDGGWNDLNYKKNELLLIFGEKFSNYVPALEHRVINSLNDEPYRISVSFFIS